MPPIYVRGLCDRAAVAVQKPGDPITFVASTSRVARDGMAIDANGWDTTNFSSNPTILWAHDYGGFNSPRPPIGRAENVRVKDGNLLADVVFDQDDDFARSIERKIRGGFLNAVSVGFDIKQFEPADEQKGSAPTVTKAELIEISVVPVPADPGALAERQRREFAALGAELSRLADAITGEPASDTTTTTPPSLPTPAASGGAAASTDLPTVRAALPFVATDKAPVDASWDASTEVAAASDEADYRRMFTWVDSSADPENKGSYKLPHHLHTGEVVWRGVAAAMARLLQAGTDIPDADRRGVYSHLSKHYKQFEKEPPEFRSVEELNAYQPAQIRGLFLEGEPELVPDEFAWHETRAGKVLSTRNRDRIEQAISALQEVLRTAEQPDESKQSPEPDSESGVDVLAGFLDKLKGIAA